MLQGFLPKPSLQRCGAAENPRFSLSPVPQHHQPYAVTSDAELPRCWLDCPQDQPSTPQHSWRRDTPFWPSCRDLRQRYPRRSSASGWKTFDPIFSYDPSLPSGAPWWPWLYNLEPDGGCCLSCVLRTYLACLSQSFPPPLWSVPERSFPGFGGRCSCTIETSPFRVQCLKATGGPCSFSDRNRP